MVQKSIKNYDKTINEILKLTYLEESRLLKPIQEGKWSAREIIGHLYYWDKFILEQQAPHIVNGSKLTPFPDHDSHNQEAMTYISKFETIKSLIDEFTKTRKELIGIFSSKDKDIKFLIGTGKRQFTIDSFLNIFTKHDAHHLKQIKDSLNKGNA
jgi:uncharacterized damage-inducible protein DinB